MSKRVAVILSGCGVFDGSEIQEAVFTLLSLDQAGAKVQCAAPDNPQAEVINHLTHKPAHEQRNVLAEAARIARGKIVPLSEISADDFDAVILPGGFGAAKNLCTYAKDGTASHVDADLIRVLRDFHDAGKPIGAWCIAPVILAQVFGKNKPAATLTIGNDQDTAGHLKHWGAHHQECPVTEFVTDEQNRLVTVPAYMYNATPAQVFDGIQKGTRAVLEMA